MERLSEEQVEQLLGQLATEWHLTHETKLRRAYAFKNFPALTNFLDQVAKLGASLAHEPQVRVEQNIVIIQLWTEARGGLTKTDFHLAKKIDQLN